MQNYSRSIHLILIIYDDITTVNNHKSIVEETSLQGSVYHTNLHRQLFFLGNTLIILIPTSKQSRIIGRHLHPHRNGFTIISYHLKKVWCIRETYTHEFTDKCFVLLTCLISIYSIIGDFCLTIIPAKEQINIFSPIIIFPISILTNRLQSHYFPLFIGTATFYPSIIFIIRSCRNQLPKLHNVISEWRPIGVCFISILHAFRDVNFTGGLIYGFKNISSIQTYHLCRLQLDRWDLCGSESRIAYGS